MFAIFIIVVGVREYFENPDWLVIEDRNPVRDCGGILCCGSWVEASKSTHGEKKDFVIVGLSVCGWRLMGCCND